MKSIEEVYPKEVCYPYDPENFWAPCEYDPMLESFGFDILLKVDDHDYQGDSRILYRDGERYGILIFGWGSCSGCDSLQACSSYEDIENLQIKLASSIEWGTRISTFQYLHEHDWEGDYSWHAEETKQFVEQAIKMLEDKD